MRIKKMKNFQKFQTGTARAVGHGPCRIPEFCPIQKVVALHGRPCRLVRPVQTPEFLKIFYFKIRWDVDPTRIISLPTFSFTHNSHFAATLTPFLFQNTKTSIVIQLLTSICPSQNPPFTNSLHKSCSPHHSLRSHRFIFFKFSFLFLTFFVGDENAPKESK